MSLLLWGILEIGCFCHWTELWVNWKKKKRLNHCVSEELTAPGRGERREHECWECVSDYKGEHRGINALVREAPGSSQPRFIECGRRAVNLNGYRPEIGKVGVQTEEIA